MNKTKEVDRDYLWALEVLASDSINKEDVPSSDYAEALRVARTANLRRPRDRYPDEEINQEH